MHYLTYSIQFKSCVLNSKTLEQLLDPGAEGAGGLAEHHHLVLLDVGLHLLHG